MNESDIGQIVHYVLPDGDHRPAVVVATDAASPLCVSLQQFTDGPNDMSATGLVWRGGVRYSACFHAHTWHWPEGDSDAADYPRT